ncbi:hypothetical protein NHX12_017032 [Muraenolepis orangiensis]|uniref:DUF4371 domain-containing protein n=1 Tax=Muraenolepis orangiensis TaxID=630683 RepID=A0A9Q0I1A5_9TELE|nr:hypothetical protein NHX12_017032 [Muraenolepis orangiensis]
MALIGRKRWREVLKRIVAIIQSLAERNVALRGSADTLYHPNNGNFLKEVELMAKFEPVLKHHIEKIGSRVGNMTTFLGKKYIQNELISAISEQIMEAMIGEIKVCKYFSILLDCTPDISHTEQLSVVRMVSVDIKPQVKEHCMGFLEAEASTGEQLSALILKRLEDLNIPFDDCRGQSDDNGANMRGKRKGVQARLLAINPSFICAVCCSHVKLGGG